MIIAAPASGSGKTTVTLGLLRTLVRAGLKVSSFKVGPDYIDPGFHEAATGQPSLNLDSWAMRSGTLEHLLRGLSLGDHIVVGEGVMGLFDGAESGQGSTAEVADLTGLPVMLVVDASAQAQSVAPLIHGFQTWDRRVTIGGTIFNRVGSERHARLLRTAVETLDIPVMGCLSRSPGLDLPSRHLGLVQASEIGQLEQIIEKAADLVESNLDIEALLSIASRPVTADSACPRPPLPPLGQRIAIARDDAFRFSYPHVIDGWRLAGASILPFSPLADQPPHATCDAVYLPGGYPELHAGSIAGNQRFMRGLRDCAERGDIIYGECGGYMVLGESLTDQDGAAHRMAGLLPLATSFAEPRLHLGYREVELSDDGPLGPAGLRLRGHEFHYATLVRENAAERLFRARDSSGKSLGMAGLRRKTVMGSFIHLIDRC